MNSVPTPDYSPSGSPEPMEADYEPIVEPMPEPIVAPAVAPKNMTETFKQVAGTAAVKNLCIRCKKGL